MYSFPSAFTLRNKKGKMILQSLDNLLCKVTALSKYGHHSCHRHRHHFLLIFLFVVLFQHLQQYIFLLVFSSLIITNGCSVTSSSSDHSLCFKFVFSGSILLCCMSMSFTWTVASLLLGPSVWIVKKYWLCAPCILIFYIATNFFLVLFILFYFSSLS